MSQNKPTRSGFRHQLHTVIFEADTPGGKLFDVALLLAIVLSIIAVCLESVVEFRLQHGTELRLIEWILTIGFTVEYFLRLYCVDRPLRYARSFYGVVDLLSILPTYLSLLFVGTQSLLVIRALRLLRIFRVFKLGHFVSEADLLMRALGASKRKIMIFLGAVGTLMLILGTFMYLVEGNEGGGFTSIPTSIYWAVVTMTTVGYGDIAPVTVLGKFIAAIAMVTGYAVIAVPTGIVGIEMQKAYQAELSTQACPSCSLEGHDADAKHCKHCGVAL